MSEPLKCDGFARTGGASDQAMPVCEHRQEFELSRSVLRHEQGLCHDI
jgi:hypothetical protein